jgi:hypothetical protein
VTDGKIIIQAERLGPSALGITPELYNDISAIFMITMIGYIVTLGVCTLIIKGKERK